MKEIEKLEVEEINFFNRENEILQIQYKLNEVIENQNEIVRKLGEDSSHSSSLTPIVCPCGVSCFKDGKCVWCHVVSERSESAANNVREQSCKCACHENKLKQPYEHDIKCCNQMNGAVTDEAEDWEKEFWKNYVQPAPHNDSFGVITPEEMLEFIRRVLASQKAQIRKEMKELHEKDSWMILEEILSLPSLSQKEEEE